MIHLSLLFRTASIKGVSPFMYSKLEYRMYFCILKEQAKKVIDALKLNSNQFYSLISNDSTIETFFPEEISNK